MVLLYRCLLKQLQKQSQYKRNQRKNWLQFPGSKDIKFSFELTFIINICPILIAMQIFPPKILHPLPPSPSPVFDHSQSVMVPWIFPLKFQAIEKQTAPWWFFVLNQGIQKKPEDITWCLCTLVSYTLHWSKKHTLTYTKSILLNFRRASTSRNNITIHLGVSYSEWKLTKASWVSVSLLWLYDL